MMNVHFTGGIPTGRNDASNRHRTGEQEETDKFKAQATLKIRLPHEQNNSLTSQSQVKRKPQLLLSI